MKSWRDLSIAKKYYFVIGTMGVLIVCELLMLGFALRTLSSVRASVAGEGSWSKSQKDAAVSLHRYALTRDESDFQAFLEQLKVPEGDHRARIELLKPAYDLDVARRGFLQGQMHPDDIDATISLLRCFHGVSYITHAMDVWARADVKMEQFKNAGIRYHDLLRAGSADKARIHQLLGHLSEINRQLTDLEVEFSEALGQGSRWLERSVISLLFVAVLLVETLALTLTYRTTHQLSRGLAEVNEAAARIGHGEFHYSVTVRSKDEIGALSDSINRMGSLLDRTYRELEVRVANRTADLEAMAKENARLYEQASGAVKMRDEFFSIASHELKTPLTALNLQLQLLARQLREPTPAQAQLLDACLRQGQRLTLLSSELLDLTRIRVGKLEIRRESCDLAAIVRDVALQLGPEAARADSSLELRSKAPVIGDFDPTRIGQVATNLISNAIKYGASRPITVEVHKDGDLGIIEVRDRGVGIAPQDQQRVFKRFERATGKHCKTSGLGLGLFISRQIVETHGGKISVKSKPGEGSVFSVEIPLTG